jgi:Zn-dependent protease
MKDENDLMEITGKPEDEEVKKTSFPRTIVSLALFIGVYYWIFKSWFAVLLLVTVIVIHEAGHFIAMKFFGYKAVNMTFVPFVGAYVSGQATLLSRKNKLIVLLAGPVPGVIIGCTLFYCHQLNANPLYFQLAMPFLLLNLFNLLPIFPLDGGQFLQTLYFTGSRIIQLCFLLLSFATLVFLFFSSGHQWFLLLIALLVLVRIWNVQHTNRIRQKLDAAGIDYACTYEDLTDEEYWHIRNVLISQSRILSRKYSTEEPAEDEQELIRLVENILVPGFDEDITTNSKWLFTLLWLACLALPVWQWLWYKGLL